MIRTWGLVISCESYSSRVDYSAMTFFHWLWTKRYPSGSWYASFYTVRNTGQICSCSCDDILCISHYYISRSRNMSMIYFSWECTSDYWFHFCCRKCASIHDATNVFTSCNTSVQQGYGYNHWGCITTYFMSCSHWIIML